MSLSKVTTMVFTYKTIITRSLHKLDSTLSLNNDKSRNVGGVGNSEDEKGLTK